jgi:hypothetical protein
MKEDPPNSKTRTMNIPFPQAKKICTATEFQLLQTVRSAAIKDLKAPALKAKIARTRGFLGKWRDLGISQARKSGKATAPERTQQKVVWFGEALRRLEDQLTKLEKAAAAEAKRATQKAQKAAKARAAIKASGVGKRVLGKKSKSSNSLETLAKVRSQRIAKSGQLRARGHALASGRRNQARRNAR